MRPGHPRGGCRGTAPGAPWPRLLPSDSAQAGLRLRAASGPLPAGPHPPRSASAPPPAGAEARARPRPAPPCVGGGHGRIGAAGTDPLHPPPPPGTGTATAAGGRRPLRRGRGWVRPCGGGGRPCATSVPQRCPRVAPVAVPQRPRRSPAPPLPAPFAAAPGSAPSSGSPWARPGPAVPGRRTLRGTAPLGCRACPRTVPSCATRVPGRCPSSAAAVPRAASCRVLPRAVGFLPAVPFSRCSALPQRHPPGAAHVRHRDLGPPAPVRVCLSFQSSSSPAPSPGVDFARSSPAGPAAAGPRHAAVPAPGTSCWAPAADNFGDFT